MTSKVQLNRSKGTGGQSDLGPTRRRAAAWQDDAAMMRSFHFRDYPAAHLVAAQRGRRVSVCLPARNEGSNRRSHGGDHPP